MSASYLFRVLRTSEGLALNTSSEPALCRDPIFPASLILYQTLLRAGITHPLVITHFAWPSAVPYIHIPPYNPAPPPVGASTGCRYRRGLYYAWEGEINESRTTPILCITGGRFYLVTYVVAP